jgi:hypothetical protein
MGQGHEVGDLPAIEKRLDCCRRLYGERLEAKDRSESTAIKRWVEAARYRGG